MLDRNAISDRAIRKNVPIIRPPGICPNNTGSVENKRVCPSSILRPKTRIAGTRISETSIEALRSPSPLKIATRGIFSDFFK